MKYFVSYAYFLKNGGHGFGNIGIDRSWPISGPEDIEDLTAQITDAVSQAMAKNLTLTIMSWQPFEPDIKRIHSNKGGSNVIRVCPPSPNN